MSIVTDSAAEMPKNVYDIHRLFRTSSELESLYNEHRGHYKVLKEALAADINTTLKPLRSRRATIVANESQVEEVLQTGAARAKTIAEAKMNLVREQIGLGSY